MIIESNRESIRCNLLTFVVKSIVCGCVPVFVSQFPFCEKEMLRQFNARSNRTPLPAHMEMPWFRLHVPWKASIEKNFSPANQGIESLRLKWLKWYDFQIIF